MRRPAAAKVLFAAIHHPANRRSLPLRAVIFFLVLGIVQYGCAASPKKPTPPSSEERASFGTVGIARAYYTPETAVDASIKGRGMGAAKGVGAGFVGGLAAGAPAGPVGAVLGGLLGAPVGAVVGALSAMPEDEVDSCQRLLRETLESAGPQQHLQEEVLQAAAGNIRHPLVPVHELGPATPDNVAANGSLVENGVRTVLEVSVERVALGATKQGSDPPLSLTMDARSRLIRTADGKIINESKFRRTSGYRKFAEWAADNAALLDREYKDEIHEFALEIVRWNFAPGFAPAGR